MNGALLEQAKHIHETVRLLRDRMVSEFNTGARTSAAKDLRDLTFNQCMTVMSIQGHEPVTIKELAQRMRVTPPSASTMVDKLVDMHILLREQSRQDRREVQVRLSPEGAAAAKEMEEHMLRSIVRLLERLGPRNARAWCSIYSKIQRVIEQEMDETQSRATRESSE